MKPILDPASGSRMFYFDRENPLVLFGDIRKESHTLCDGRSLEINPDQLMDFRALPFADETFYLVIFDPPHFNQLGATSWLAKKYGRLLPHWEDDIRQGFEECFRVLKPNGTLVFKWNDTQIPIGKVLELCRYLPIAGSMAPKKTGTHWIVFFKEEQNEAIL